MKIGSLFAGIGGFDLAAKWVGWSTAWYSEVDPYACAIMAKHFLEAVNYGDITKIDGRTVAPIDLLCGGFPCQDISLAGKGAGLSGARSGLWSHYARLIEEIQPRWVVIENVPALRSRGLDQVLGQISEIGYDAEWHCIPAAAVGAPHRRDRIWIVAYTRCDGGECDRGLGELERAPSTDQSTSQERQRIRDAVGNSGADVAYSVSEGELQSEGCLGKERGRVSDGGTTRNQSDSRKPCCADVADAAGQGLEGRSGSEAAWTTLGRPRRDSWWATEPDVGRVADGVPAWVDRLRCLGNAVVPQVAEVIFRAIQRVESARSRGKA